MAEIRIEDALTVSEATLRELKTGGTKRIIKLGHSFAVTLPKFLFKIGSWKSDDQINMIILSKQNLIVLHNPTAQQRETQLTEKLKGRIKW